MRNSLLFKLLDKRDNLVIDYIYIKILINIKYKIQTDSKLTETQKDMIINDFNSIPKFYYSIRTLTDSNELTKYKLFQKDKISKSINVFFSEPDNILERENIQSLINFRGYFGTKLLKKDFLILLRILPFKYFTFDIEKNIVDFSFPLVKDVFDDFLSHKLVQMDK